MRRFDRIRRALKRKASEIKKKEKRSLEDERTDGKNKGAVSPPVANERSERGSVELGRGGGGRSLRWAIAPRRGINIVGLLR